MVAVGGLTWWLRSLNTRIPSFQQASEEEAQRQAEAEQREEAAAVGAKTGGEESKREYELRTRRRDRLEAELEAKLTQWYGDEYTILRNMKPVNAPSHVLDFVLKPKATTQRGPVGIEAKVIRSTSMVPTNMLSMAMATSQDATTDSVLVLALDPRPAEDDTTFHSRAAAQIAKLEQGVSEVNAALVNPVGVCVGRFDDVLAIHPRQLHQRIADARETPQRLQRIEVGAFPP